MKMPTLLELLKAGVHFGHSHSKWHPKMASYIYTTRNTIHIIDLEKTVQKLKEALEFIKDLASKKSVILFVGLKPTVEKIVKAKAEEAGMPYVVERWIGGTLTNFSTVKKLIEKLEKLEKDKSSGEFSKYTKKEQLKFEQEIKKLTDMVGGIRSLEKLPEALFIVDCKKAKVAIEEARRMKIPTVAIVDTNVNPEKITWPIPANDDSVKSVKLIMGLIVEAIKEGVGRSK
jgi:small subunit ribosomal protein S2